MKLFAFIFFVVICSCKDKDEFVPVLPDKPEGLKLIWQKSLKENNDYVATDKPIISPNSIAFFYDLVEDREKILLVEKDDTSGIRIFGPNLGDYKRRRYIPDIGYVLMDYRNLFILDETKKLKKVWSVPPQLDYGFDISIIEDYAYINANSHDDLNSYVYKINLHDYNSSIHFEVHSINENDTLDKIGLTPPSLFKASSSQSIFLYRTSRRPKTTIFGNYSTEAYDINMEHRLWKRNFSIGPEYNLLNYNYNLIYCSSDSIYSLNSISGKNNWSLGPIHTGLPLSWAVRGVHLVKNKICLIEEGYYVEIDAENGKVIYESPQLFTGQCSEMTFFEGVFYWSAYGELYGMRESDHKLVLKMKSPNAGRAPYYNDTNFDWNGLQIDPMTRRGYTSDGFFAMCFEIPESYE